MALCGRVLFRWHSSTRPLKLHCFPFTERAAKPVNPLLNVEESRLIGHITQHPSSVIDRTRTALLRVYPKGLRVLSHNLDPLGPWRHGAQVVALNFQRFDRPLQLNEAMFVGSGGWVLKPAHLREGTREEVLAKRPRMRVQVRLGAISGRESWRAVSSSHELLTPTLCATEPPVGTLAPRARKPYCEVKLYHSHQRFKARSATLAVGPGEDGGVWDKLLGGPWDVEDDELVFVRCVRARGPGSSPTHLTTDAGARI